MKIGIKMTKPYAYEFDLNGELMIYSEIGEGNSSFHNYSEWHNYVCEKYGGDKYSESTLKNFVHYMKREKNVIASRKEVWSGCVVPLLTVFITIVFTLVFSVVNVINTYNNSINTLWNDEFFKYSGYNVKMIYEALHQDLYSGMAFYAFGALIMVVTVLLLLNIASNKIRYNNLKNELLSDYIMIIQEIIEMQTIASQTIALGGENGS